MPLQLMLKKYELSRNALEFCVGIYRHTLSLWQLLVIHSENFVGIGLTKGFLTRQSVQIRRSLLLGADVNANNDLWVGRFIS